ncbi:diacylglycerol kinase [Niabella beijingensis]|uniref:diacylglycerol kinase n=1 Tax=Niabella beijingensis TaxID=2872700 RepID=UPI001CBCC529|nr:diacylglycerol kinase family protein [Niabella beijingensis]MBZ4190424.1 diacylglycerol kinase family protein [Niabella beijingensis]
MSGFSVKKLVKGFGYAGSGLKAAFLSEQNFRVHVVAAVLVVLMGAVFDVHAFEWLILIICVVMVMGMELLNTAVEKLCDRIMPEKDPGIRYIKDVSAAAVLVVAIGAAAAGLIIFIPRLLQWI